MLNQDSAAISGAGLFGSIRDIPDPPALPEPDAFVRIVLESPWLIAGALFGGGLIVLFWMRSRDQARLGLHIGCVIMFAALGMIGLATWVKTPREKAILTTRALVAAVADADLHKLDASMDDSCMLYYFETPTGLDKRAIMDVVRSRMSPGAVYSIKGGARGVRYEAMQASVRGETAQVQVKVAVTSAQWGVPHRSWWRLELTRARDGEWRVAAIMPTSMQGVRNASGR